MGEERIGRPGDPERGQGSLAAGDRSKKPVLVIEDDPDVRELMVLLLESSGYRALTARDGRSALKQIERELPAAILLDMMMPGMDGWHFAEAFRARYGRSAPLIVMTAGEDAGKTAQEIGAAAHVGKPFEVDEVLGLIERYAATGGAQPAS